MRSLPDELVRRAEIHAALGDPIRVAVVDALRASDRSPKELSQLLGVAPNLLAFHLDALERVGLIERIASSGDRRRRYVRLLSHELDVMRSEPPPANRRITFVCTQNSARSQLAAAVWRHDRGGDATSAGTEPARAVHPGTLAAAARAGLDLGDTTPKRLEQDTPDRLLVTVCDRAHEQLNTPHGWHWSIPDPADDGTDAAFDLALDLIRARVGAFTLQEQR